MLLGKSGGKYAVLAWSYGSCSGCDGYEDLYYGSRDYKNDPQNKKGFNSVVAAIGENIELAASEEDARALFDKRKGW